MYNGIGLETARGSGTNGYVTRNIAVLRNQSTKVDYKTEDEIKKLDAQMMKKPNLEILEHARKRKVELKCMEMQELMEEQGYSKEEVEKKVSTFRKMLMQKEGVSDQPERDESGRLIASGTHAVAEANQVKNDKLREAFGLSEYFVDGSSLDPNRKVKQDEAKAIEMAQKKYALVRDESESPERTEPKKKKKKHRHSSRSDSESRSRDRKKKRKSRHHHHGDKDGDVESEEEESKSSKKAKKSKEKRREKKKSRKRKLRSPSSSTSSEESGSEEDDSSDDSSAEDSSPERTSKKQKSTKKEKSPSQSRREEKSRSPGSSSRRSNADSHRRSR